MIIKTGLISRVAFSIGDINIYWYAILIVSSILLGIVICKLKDGKFGVKFDDLVDLLVFLLPISLIGARLYYVLFTLDYYLKYPSQILNFRDGGLAIYGGIIAGIITIIVFCKIKKINWLNILDYIAPCLALGQSIGRWGNYINVEAYGVETNFLIKMEVIEQGITKYVHPTFLYESVITFCIFILLTILSNKRKFRGEITYLYIILYSFARMFIEYLRTDSLMLYNMKISLILSLIFFVVFAVIYAQKRYYSNKNETSVE